jgi:hypothetical protein
VQGTQGNVGPFCNDTGIGHSEKNPLGLVELCQRQLRLCETERTEGGHRVSREEGREERLITKYQGEKMKGENVRNTEGSPDWGQ